MYRLWWQLRAAWYLSRLICDWYRPEWKFCWEIASVCFEAELEAGDAGCPYEAIDEELSNWDE